MFGPAVNQQDGHRAIHRLEHAPCRHGGRVVVGLVSEGAVIRLDDVLKLGERLVSGPEFEHIAGNHLAVFKVDDLAQNLLLVQLRSLVLLQLLLEGCGKVLFVLVGAGAVDHHIVTLAPDEVEDQVLGARRSRHNDLGRVTQTQAEHHHVPRLLDVVECGQLITPCKVELRAAQALV